MSIGREFIYRIIIDTRGMKDPVYISLPNDVFDVFYSLVDDSIRSNNIDAEVVDRNHDEVTINVTDDSITYEDVGKLIYSYVDNSGRTTWSERKTCADEDGDECEIVYLHTYNIYVS